jgi:hypothetical protein
MAGVRSGCLVSLKKRKYSTDEVFCFYETTNEIKLTTKSLPLKGGSFEFSFVHYYQDHVSLYMIFTSNLRGSINHCYSVSNVSAISQYYRVGLVYMITM